MRLLNADRSRMRHAILEEVPRTDYADLIQRKAMSLAVDALPPEAKKLWRDKGLRPLLAVNSVGFGYDDNRRRHVTTAYVPGFKEDHGSITGDPEIVRLIELAHEQDDTRTALDRELRVNFAAVGTHEEFAKRWPELTKYLPDGSEAKSANLPATTALLDDLKAAGLPLDTEAQAA